MTLTEHVIALVAMALAIITILVVGTLAAADILPIRRRAWARTSVGGDPTFRGGDDDVPPARAGAEPGSVSGR